MDVWPLFGSILLIVVLAALALVILSLAVSLSIAILRVALKPTDRRKRDEDFLPPRESADTETIRTPWEGMTALDEPEADRRG